MFVYNITSKVEHSILNDWLQWQKEIHIPDILATRCFYEHRFYELLEHHEDDGRTFVLQYLATSKSDYNRYIEIYAPSLNKKSTEKWKDQVFSFKTLMVNVE
ncbi:MAG: DUF4286 family protein [Ginsengibacter sp.]